MVYPEILCGWEEDRKRKNDEIVLPLLANRMEPVI
jgi:hypothetical protein